jgi:hypothetical protein
MPEHVGIYFVVLLALVFFAVGSLATAFGASTARAPPQGSAAG